LQSGIKIYLYNDGMLHAKNIIIDDEVASVGSTNFDFRSFEHNFEANLFVYSHEFNQRMADIFLADARHSTRILVSNWSKRPRTAKICESVLRLLSPIL
jgi:cardiolipin synthase